MKRQSVLAGLAVLCTLAACAAPRGFHLATAHPDATVHRIHLATTRAVTEDRAGSQALWLDRRNEGRSTDLAFGFVDVSVPPGRTPGKVDWPQRNARAADAARQFAVVGGGQYATVSALQAAIPDPSVTARGAEGDGVMLYIHGYNTSPAGATYRMAQIKEDFEFPWTPVVFSWSSAGRTGRYLYDKDSALFARDDLVQLIKDLAASRPGIEVDLLAHSMGSQLTMEALRQMAVSRDYKALDQISSVALMSPDIDMDLFRRQMAALDGHVPQPFAILASGNDRALQISSLLTGGGSRLGANLKRADFEGLPVTVLDVSDLSDGSNFDHTTGVSSPDAIQILRQMVDDQAIETSEFGSFLRLSRTGVTEVTTSETR